MCMLSHVRMCTSLCVCDEFGGRVRTRRLGVERQSTRLYDERSRSDQKEEHEARNQETSVRILFRIRDK